MPQTFVSVDQRQREGYWSRWLWVPIALGDLREIVSNDIGNIAANGGLLATDTTPTLEYANGDTDSQWRVLWAAANVDPIGWQLTLPPFLDISRDIEIHLITQMGGATDNPVLTLESFFGSGDTKVSDTTQATASAADEELVITIAGADIPANARTVSMELTPAAHGTDTLELTAAWALIPIV